MNYIELFVLSLFDLTMLTLIYNKLYNQLHFRLRDVIIIVNGAAIMTAIGYFVQVDLLLQLIGQVAIAYLFILKLRVKIKELPTFATAYVVATLMVFFVQFVVVMGATLFIDVQQVFVQGFVFQSIGLLLVFILSRYLPIVELHYFIDKKSIWGQVIILNLLVVIAALNIFWYINPSDLMDAVLYIIVIFLLGVVITSKVINDGLVDKQQAEKLRIYETYIPIIDSVVEQMKLVQHDFNNHVQTMQALNEKYELNTEMKDYIDELHLPVDETKYLFFDNKIVMALLYSKINEAKDKGIDVSLEVNNYHMETRYTDYELIEMYGILLTNAIEALEDQSEKVMKIKMSWRDQQNCFEVSNFVDRFEGHHVHRMFDYKQTTKEDGRGLGLHKLKTFVDKQGGNINVSYDNNLKMLKIEVKHH